MNDIENSQKDYDFKNVLKHDWWILLVLVGLLIEAVLVYPHLPAQVPFHWNIDGQVDRYAARSVGAFFPPVLTAVVYAGLALLPLIDPKRASYPRFDEAYGMIRSGLVLFLTVVYEVTIVIGLGYTLNVPMIILAGLGLFIIMIGNRMGQFRHNYFVGIKTPWTLASEEVWNRTHRMAAWLWVAGGLVCLGAAFLPGRIAFILFLSAMAVIALVPIIYSAVIYKKPESQDK
ncbi:MAG: SdpI family protein [Solirubrobacterales bacterium]